MVSSFKTNQRFFHVLIEPPCFVRKPSFSGLVKSLALTFCVFVNNKKKKKQNKKGRNNEK